MALLNQRFPSSEEKTYKTAYLDGIKLGNENALSIKIFKYIHDDYDYVIVGCYNSPVQMIAIAFLRLLGKKYILSTDGEQFVDLKTVKGKIKCLILKGADKYFVAGKKSAETLYAVVGRDRKIIPYYFSSLTQNELEKHAKKSREAKRERYILVIGQYYDYKGLDVAVKVAGMDSSIKYKFVGMGKRTELFAKETGADKLSNVEIIPFLQKRELEEEYLKCAVMMLPSRQECWGLVVNEAASFGTPIVSTRGSGAAVEFLSDQYPQYIAEPGNADELLATVKRCLNTNTSEYENYLLNVSVKYCIENGVNAYIEALSK